MENKNEVAPTKSNKLIEFEKTLADSVQNRIHELSSNGRLDLPPSYSVGNALNSAWLKILDAKDKNSVPALEVCSKESIANALLDMAILGLNPAKQHGYFIVYGKKLTWFTSYFGNIAAVSRLKGFETLPTATLIYQGDEIEIEHDEYGEEYISKHKTTWEAKSKGEITGAYATIQFGDRKRTAILPMREIKESWSMSQTNKDHKIFTGEFAKRTAFNRLMKTLLKTSTDDDIVAETLLKTEEEHYDFDNEKVIESVKLEVQERTAKVKAPEPTELTDEMAETLFDQVTGEVQEPNF